MRVLVTGASGFLGRHLCRALRERGDFVVGLLRDIGPDAANADTVTVVGSYEQVERAIAEYEIEAVVHLAAQTQVSTAVSDPVGTFEANIAGTWRVLDACRRQKVGKVIVASSDKVYGATETPYREVHPILPGGVYATSKACADMLAHSYYAEYGLPVVVTRCGNLYGPGHTNWSTLIPGTIRSLLRGERPRLRSDGGPRRDYLHVSDAVCGYLALLDQREIRHLVYNFGTGVGSSVRDVVLALQQVTGVELEPIVGRSEALEIQDQVLCANLARQDLGWEPEHDLLSGLRDTVEWYRNYLGIKSIYVETKTMTFPGKYPFPGEK